MKRLIPSLLVLLFSTTAFALPDEFHTITPNLYRGGRPTVSDLRELADRGITTIVDLENNRTVVQAEADAAQALGIEFVHIPLRTDVAPSDEDIDQALQEMRRSPNEKVFLHCHYGQDRTGIVSALYRVEIEGWAPDRAYREMMENGFNMKYARTLEIYFRNRVGL